MENDYYKYNRLIGDNNMKLNFYYDESVPTYKKYQELLFKMKQLSVEFYSLDNMFFSKYNYHSIKKYEKDKLEIIDKMFKEIISYFPNLSNDLCAIYLNGSFARGNITAGSDIDLTFYFKKNEASKYQPTIYLIRYAISNMLNVNMVHVHSFTKNFTTEFRKKNNLIIKDLELITKIYWTIEKETIIITYPINQMIAEREICEITSIKDIESLEKLYNKQISKLHPKEWIYTHKCIHITNKFFNIEKIIEKLDKLYTNKDIKTALTNIKKEIQALIVLTKNYYLTLNKSKTIELNKFNMIGKRKVTMLVHAFATYLRWYYISKNLGNIPKTLNLDILFNYKTNEFEKEIIDNIEKSYCYFRYIISRIEIWAKKYDHHYEHRSKEIIKKSILNKEYNNLWKADYLPIEEQTKAFNKLIKNIIFALDKLL